MARAWMLVLVCGVVALAPAAAGCMTHMRADEVDAGPADALVLPDASSTPLDAGPPLADAHLLLCEDQDARGEGACRAVLGYAWGGGRCHAITGCDCAGAHCDWLAPSLEACLESHSACARTCGGFAETGCLEREFCDYPDSSYCGGDDSEGVCVRRPDDCPEPGDNRVCGCDGVEYVSACSAHYSGVDVATRTPPCR